MPATLVEPQNRVLWCVCIRLERYYVHERLSLRRDLPDNGLFGEAPNLLEVILRVKISRSAVREVCGDGSTVCEVCIMAWGMMS